MLHKHLKIPSSCCYAVNDFIDVEKTLDNFYKYIIMKVRAEHSKPYMANCVVLHCQLKRELGKAKICRHSKVKVINDMERRGMIRFINKRRIEIL